MWNKNYLVKNNEKLYIVSSEKYNNNGEIINYDIFIDNNININDDKLKTLPYIINNIVNRGLNDYYIIYNSIYVIKIFREDNNKIYIKRELNYVIN